MSRQLDNEFAQIFKGLLRGNATEKEETCVRLVEGKNPMSFPLYNFLCKKMVEDGHFNVEFNVQVEKYN